MKKKIFVISLACVLQAALLSSCFLLTMPPAEDQSGQGTDTSSSEPASTPEQQPESEESSASEEPAEPQEEKGVFHLDDADVKITGFEVDSTTVSDWEDREAVIVLYDFTNTSDEPVDPSTTWAFCVEATQETDAAIMDLDICLSFDEKYDEAYDMAHNEIKPGATVSCMAAYYMEDSSSPVTLTVTESLFGDELGQAVFDPANAQ